MFLPGARLAWFPWIVRSYSLPPGRVQFTVRKTPKINVIRKVPEGQGQPGRAADKRTSVHDPDEEVWKRKSRSSSRASTGSSRAICRCHLAVYSLAVNSLWPTDCGCPTVPF